MMNQPMNVIPGVVESGPRGERFWDIYSLLLKERIIMLFTPISDPVANTIIAQLLYLEREDPERAEIVMLKFFTGLSNKETARTLGISERSVERRWAFAKACLFQIIRELEGASERSE